VIAEKEEMTMRDDFNIQTRTLGPALLAAKARIVGKGLPRLSLVLMTWFLTLLFCLDSAFATELSEGWTSVRALGMGNAFTAVVEDSESLFYNPAGLARNKNVSWTLGDVRAGLNGLDTVQRVSGLTGADKTNFPAKLSDLYGHPIWAEGGAKSAFMVPGFAVAGFASTNAGIFVENPAYPTLNLNYFFDYGITAGGAFDVVPEFFKIGIVTRRVNRTGAVEAIGPSKMANLDPTSLKAELQRRGTGYGVDVGAVLTAPGPVKPTLSFVMKNVGMTTFTYEAGAGAPPPIKPEMILGGSFEITGPLISLRPAFDFKYMNRADVPTPSKVHLGVELGLPLIDIRGGFNQGYYTAGVGLDLGILRVDAATYGVELGEYPGQREDRRYVAQVTIEFDFDPSKFSLGGSGGSGHRRLKQRR
jgi:hypothetical protein